MDVVTLDPKTLEPKTLIGDYWRYIIHLDGMRVQIIGGKPAGHIAVRKDSNPPKVDVVSDKDMGNADILWDLLPQGEPREGVYRLLMTEREFEHPAGPVLFMHYDIYQERNRLFALFSEGSKKVKQLSMKRKKLKEELESAKANSSTGPELCVFPSLSEMAESWKKWAVSAESDLVEIGSDPKLISEFWNFLGLGIELVKRAVSTREEELIKELGAAGPQLKRTLRDFYPKSVTHTIAFVTKAIEEDLLNRKLPSTKLSESAKVLASCLLTFELSDPAVELKLTHDNKPTSVAPEEGFVFQSVSTGLTNESLFLQALPAIVTPKQLICPPFIVPFKGSP